jgi:hypothetical protein
MDNFEKKYKKYIKKLKNEIPYDLFNEYHDFKFNFKHNFIQSNSFLNIIAILWWVCGSTAVTLLDNNVIIRIIVFVIWLGIGIWYLIFNGKHTDDIADYFFYKYEYHKIIEDRIKRDEQRDIQNLLNVMFSKERLNIDDLDVFLEVYESKLEDIKYFYARCLSEIKYEDFDEKII